MIYRAKLPQKNNDINAWWFCTSSFPCSHSGHWEHPKLLGSGSVIIRWHMSGVYLWPHGIADSFLFTLSVPMWAINHVNDLIIIAPEWNKELWPFLDNSISGLFFNTTALLKHNLHTILLTHLKLQLSGCIFTDLCSHHCGNFRTFHHPTKKPCTNCVPFHFLPTPQPYATTNLLSVYVDLPILDISYKWNPMICGFCG